MDDHKTIATFRHDLMAEIGDMPDGMERETYVEIADFIDEAIAALDIWTKKENR